MASQSNAKTKTAAKKTPARSTPAKSATGQGKKKTASRTSPAKNAGRGGAVRSRGVESQHREIWVVVTFFLSLVLLLAVFNVKGFLLEALAGFFKGLVGFGAYVLPFALLVVCGTILFARGKPIAGRIITTMLLPVMVGILAHLLFSQVTLDQHVITMLYETGKTLHSGGVISGSIGALLSAALSNVGALIIAFILFVILILRFMNIRLKTILEFFIGIHDKAELRRESQDFYDEEYEEEGEPVREAVAPLPAKRQKAKPQMPPVPAAAQLPPVKINKGEAKPARAADHRRPIYDLPLDQEPPVEPQEAVQEEPAPETAHSAFWGHAEPKKKKNSAAPDVQFEEPKYEPPRPLEDAEPEEDEPPFDLEPEDVPVEPQITNYAAPAAVAAMSGMTSAPILEEDPPVVEEIPTEQVPMKPHLNGPDPVVVDTHQITEEAPADEVALEKAQATAKREYEFPPISLLHEDEFVPTDDVTEELRVRSHKLADTLSSFGVEAQIINVIRGPSVTRYEILLDRGVKFSRLTGLQDDIALALGASGVRIAAIPDKSAVGIEVPNKVIQTVYLREVLTSRPMAESKSKLAFALGKDITGTSIIADIGRMPHMLIAGTTGSGKSVCINSIIVSLLYRASPNEVKLIMIDPKMVELGNYNGIPHLLVPVVTDYKKAAGALNWAVMEMERRYKLMFEYGARDLDSFNKVAESRGENPLPRVVIIIDELADLMMMAAKEIEESICRIAQKARAAGMHLIIATQRPSADVLTGLMKSNIPSRIAFAVASQIESRIILDTGGAEKLIGKGDMLFNPLGMPKPLRVQGCFLSSGEVEAVTEFVKRSGTAEYSSEIMEHMERSASTENEGGGYSDDEDADEMLDEAIDVVMQTGQASASMLQRKLKLGYARAARIIDQMEDRGIIGPFDGAKPRQLLISKSDWQEIKARRSY